MCRLAFTTAECCLVFDRPTGAKLIGFFYTTLFFFGLLGPIVELNRYRTERNANYLSGGGNFTISNHENVFSVLEEYGHMTSAGYEGAMVFLILCLMFGVLFNILMVWGVFIKFCWLLVPWLIFHMLVIFTAFIAPILSIYYTNYIAPYGYVYEERKGTVLLAFFPIIIGLAGIYFWLVVRALFDDLDKKPEAPAPAADEPAQPKGVVVVNFFGPSLPGSPMKVAPAAPSAPPAPEYTAPPKVVD